MDLHILLGTKYFATLHAGKLQIFVMALVVIVQSLFVPNHFTTNTAHLLIAFHVNMLNVTVQGVLILQ